MSSSSCFCFFSDLSVLKYQVVLGRSSSSHCLFMVISGLSGSTTFLLSAVELFIFFFDPVQLYFKLAYLKVKLILFFCFFLGFLAALLFKYFRRLLDKLFLPPCYLVRMNFITGGDLCQCLLFLQYFKHYFCLKGWIVSFPHR